MATTCTVVWFRRDLRVEDNPALVAGVRCGTVIPLFIWSPEEEGQFQPGRVSRWWLKQSLNHLDESLRSLGAPMIMRRDKGAGTLSVLIDVLLETGATQVFYNHLYDPVSLVRDQRVKEGLLQAGVGVMSFNADLLYEPWEVNDDRGKPFTTFSAYWRKCLSMPVEPEAPLLPPKRLLRYSGHIFSCSIQDLELEDESERGSNALLARAWCPGWSNADKALEAFVDGPLSDYAINHEKADGATTSFLSPHLHYGELSVRKIFHHLRLKQVLWAREGRSNGEESVNVFLRSIGYREYSRYLSFNFPFTHERLLLLNMKFFPWRVDEGYFKAWRQGRTGYPLVDAGMREIWATGWLHNKIRVIVSSFYVKFLQLPWRWGMKYFWDALLDADLESDILGWQYVSGGLPDGREFDRMDNPQTEGYMFDPHGEYVRRWLPELSRLPTEWIHHPWDAPPSVLRAAGVELGCNYPRPIVEVAAARERLEQGLAEVWKAEAANKLASAYDTEEGVGNTIQVYRNDNVLPENLDLDRAHVQRNNENLSGGSSHDQMVPSMPWKEGKGEEMPVLNLPVNQGNPSDQFSVAGAVSRNLPNLVASPVEIHGQRLLLLPALELGATDDTDHTAESSPVRWGQNQSTVVGVSPCRFPYVSVHSAMLQEEDQMSAVHSGVLSRRHLHFLPMVNLGAMAVTKTSSLSA